jgi:apolipoprotein N-acyltransferase
MTDPSGGVWGSPPPPSPFATEPPKLHMPSPTPPKLRRGRVVIPALLSGAGIAFSLPPWGWWILAFLAAAILWWRLEGLRARTRLFAGWVAGLGLFVPGLWWSTSFNVYGGVVLILVEALALGIACLLTPPGRGRTPALVGAMVLLEALRDTWPFGGLPIGSPALGQAGGPLLYASRLGGPLLLVGLVWLGGAALGALALAATRAFRTSAADRRRAAAWAALAAHHGVDPPKPKSSGPSPRGLVLTGTSSAVLVLLVGIAGTVAPAGGPPIGHLRVAAVQGGGVRGLRKSQVNPATVLAAQFAATSEIPRVDGGRPPSLVLWPEDVVSVDGLLVDSPDYEELSALAVRLHATLVVGVTETVSSTHFRNEVVAFAPNGGLVAHYEKVHRVPFGEYVPYRSFFSHLANLSAVPLNAIPGHGDGLIRTPAGPLGVMISYEVFFSNRGRPPTRAGAELLLVPTNTSSYSTSQVPTQEIAASRLQAVEEGRDLVQAAPTGFSAIVTNQGQVLHRSSLSARDVIVATVALRRGRTIFERFGELPVLVISALLVLGGWVLFASTPDNSEGARAARNRWRQMRERQRAKVTSTRSYS